ncbi:hypothetical protein LPJ53_000163 [Coemansia erecta]|uniref:Uncharacterized protein n=1 Tax=Coemansia erecta TaxID=147472 RepID=A0A9W7Y2G5_9FUNG|nr:hypothetical protein LPJ53_000163 [Coemansia erecta]
MPYPVLLMRFANYNFTAASLVILLVLGALIGALISASGMYLLSTFLNINLKFERIPILMIALGLMSIYAASIGTSGILHGSQGHMPALCAVVLVILLGEVILMFETSMEPASVDRALYQMWRSQFNSNRRMLLRYESYYGCCGFRNPTDMPSSSNCIGRFSEGEPVLGCMHYMRESVFLQNHQALLLILTAAIAQLMIIGVGYVLYTSVYSTDTTWMVEDFADDVEAGGGVEGAGNGGQGAQVAEAAAEQIEATVTTPAADDMTAHEQEQEQDQTQAPKQTQTDDPAADTDTAVRIAQVKSAADPSVAESADCPDPAGVSESPGSKKGSNSGGGSGSGSVNSQKSQDPWPPRARTNKFK